MSILVSDADIAEVRSLYPYLKVPTLTTQHEQALMMYLKGHSAKVAAQAVGMSDAAFKALLNREGVREIIQYIQKKYMQEIVVTRELLTTLLFEAHRKSANATEEVMCIRELGKMWDVYEDAKSKRGTAAVNVIVKEVKNRKQLERLSDSQLLEMAGDMFADADIEDGEYSDA